MRRSRRAVAPIGVATGEHCANRVIFKQLLQAGAIDFCQIDSCRLGGVNENLAVILMAAKFGVPVCPHAGGVGLCELVQHLSMFDYICACPAGWTIASPSSSTTCTNISSIRCVIRRARYMRARRAGYSSEIKARVAGGVPIPGRPGVAGLAASSVRSALTSPGPGGARPRRRSCTDRSICRVRAR